MGKIKKLWSAALFLLVCCLSCGCEEKFGKKPQGTVSGKFTQSEQELIDLVLYGNAFPEGFVFAELEGYGRIIGSSDTLAEAQQIAEAEFSNSDYRVTANDPDVETACLSGLFVRWETIGSKPYAYEEYVVSFRRDVYDHDARIFHTRDGSLIEGILNYYYYQEMYQTRGSKVISAEFRQTRDAYVYSLYRTQVVYGDFGLQDCLHILHDVATIDRDTGQLSIESGEVCKIWFDESAMKKP